MNDSLNDSYLDEPDDEVCEKNEVVRFQSFVVPFFFALVIALSLVGNILVLVILALYENFRSLTNIFILNLAISDLVFTSGLPFWAIYHVQGWIFSKLVCKTVYFVFFIGFYSSVLFLTVMTIYRYFTMVHHLTDLNTKKIGTGIFVSGLMWLISIGAAMPSLLHTDLMTIPHLDEESVGCYYETYLWRDIATFQQNAFFLLAFAVMAFCYIQIWGKIKKTRSKTRNRAVRLVFAIVAAFFIGWVPYNVVIFLKILADHLVPPFDGCAASIQLDYAFCFSRLVAFSHCCLNPVFYAFIGVKFRNHLRKMFTRKNVTEEQQIEINNLNTQGSIYW